MIVLRSTAKPELGKKTLGKSGVKKFKQGIYTVKNVDKYLGDPNKVVYRSSWELSLHKFFDNNIRILKWGSEIICIPYVKPTDGKVHRYYPDYYIEYVDDNGEYIKELIELKPINQTKQPKATGKHILYEQLTFAVNTSKWEAAQRWCNTHDVRWRIVTELQVFK